jgi:hypothetical protein
MIQQQVKKVKGIADVVFCIDISQSMQDCIDGVKNYVTGFVKTLEASNQNMIIDWQIGLIGYSNCNFYMLDLQKDVSNFVNGVGNLNLEGNEFTPGALDYAISHYSWRSNANHFIALFTDEPLKGGCTSIYPGGGNELFDALLKKILDSHLRLFFFGAECSYYKKLQTVPRCTYTVTDFGTIDFSQLMAGLGKTVSQACLPEGTTLMVKDMVYDISDISVNWI